MKTGTETTPQAKNFNKPAYVVFVLAAIFFMVRKDISQAVIFWSLALVFDPFDINQSFNKRPLYQRIWLMVHVAISFVLIGLEIARWGNT